jgi:hypothetical protein
MNLSTEALLKLNEGVKTAQFVRHGETRIYSNALGGWVVVDDVQAGYKTTIPPISTDGLKTHVFYHKKCGTETIVKSQGYNHPDNVACAECNKGEVRWAPAKNVNM